MTQKVNRGHVLTLSVADSDGQHAPRRRSMPSIPQKRFHTYSPIFCASLFHVAAKPVYWPVQVDRSKSFAGINQLFSFVNNP